MIVKKPSYSYKRNTSGLGFTLVELLVVIAIIAVLAALSIGATLGIKNRAKEVVKLANLRSIFVASGSYQADNNGFLVPVSIGGRNWRSLLADYVNEADLDETKADKTTLFIDPYFEGYSASAPSITGYAMNSKPGLPEIQDSNMLSDPILPTEKRFKNSSITHSGRRVMLGDSDTEWFFNSNGKEPSTALVAKRHDKGNKGMFLTYDGTVERYNLTQAVAASTDPKTLKR